MLTLFNSLTRKKEPFTPLTKGEARFYACGPTVYNYAHLGNLRAFLFADILRRALQYDGLKVKEVMNLTDVGHLTDDADQGEDKLEKEAKKEHKSAWDVATFYTEAFLHDIDALDIERPDVLPKATDHIAEQWSMVETIMRNGYAYVTADGIYFDTSKLDDYGKLIPNFDPSSLEAGKRVDLGGKRHPTDFALWKFSPKDEKRQMEWTTSMEVVVDEAMEEELRSIAGKNPHVRID